MGLQQQPVVVRRYHAANMTAYNVKTFVASAHVTVRNTLQTKRSPEAIL